MRLKLDPWPKGEAVTQWGLYAPAPPNQAPAACRRRHSANALTPRFNGSTGERAEWSVFNFWLAHALPEGSRAA